MTTDEIYKTKLKEIESIIESLKNNFKKHSDRQAADPKNWGFVGDLGYLKNELLNLNKYFSGEDY